MDAAEKPKPDQPLTPTRTPAAGEPADLRTWLTQNSFGLILIVGVLAFILIKWGIAGLLAAFIVTLGLSFIIFIHELGHFAVAKWCDVHVETFSIGFGPALPGCRWVKGETTYMLAMVPLGGYVKMVGENPENDEDDTDPRSFKNKAVWQRMAIISAGVFMNALFGCLVFIFVYMTHGMEQQPGVVGEVSSGSPAWEKNTKAGDIIYQIGSKTSPTFGDLRSQVMVSRAGEELAYEFGAYGGPKIVTTIVPMRNDHDGRPVIGMHGSPRLELPTRAKLPQGPVQKGSAVSRATPPFEPGDQIIASSFDPNDPKKIKPLPDDPRPRRDGQKRKDYYEFIRRTVDLQDKEMLVQVQRQNDAGELTTATISVLPAGHRALGLRMSMGPVVAVQERSPAEGKVQPRNTATNLEGDQIRTIEVDKPGGGKIRWVLAPAVQKDPDVEEIIIDPVRLPFELSRWAQSVPENVKPLVKLTVLREKKHTGDEPLILEWQRASRYDQPTATSLAAPTAIPGLGLAYQVETTVQSVVENSPATRAKKDDGSTVALKPGDVITGYSWFNAGDDGEPPALGKFVELRNKVRVLFWTIKDEPLRDVWTGIFESFQVQEVPKIKLQVERGGDKFDVVLDAEEDKTWPLIERGFIFMPDTQLEKADTLPQAMSMGFNSTYNFVILIYKSLEGLVTNRISFSQHAEGPIGIARRALDVADDPYTFLLFLAMISVNLAVINFLPIPVLDGGHMVFLIYEWIRGQPAAEWVRLATTYAGLALIVSLMLYVIYLDVSRLWGG